jgi:chromosome segregation ATPase
MPEIFARQYVAPNTDTGDKAQGGMTTEGNSKVEAPFSAYADLKGHSYSSEFFNIDNAQNANDIEILEGYVQSQINSQKLNDTLASYKQVLESLFEKIGLTENHQLDVKFNKVVKYIQLLGRNKTKDERRRELIKRAEDIKKEREEKRIKSLEENYLKNKEEKNRVKNEFKQFKNKVEKYSDNTAKAIKEINDYRSKIEKVLAEKNNVVATTKDQVNKLTMEKNKLLEELRISKQNEHRLLLKHQQLKSLI